MKTLIVVITGILMCVIGSLLLDLTQLKITGAVTLIASIFVTIAGPLLTDFE